VCHDAQVSGPDPSPALDVDVSKPSAARIYDYALGGFSNYAVDRRAAEAVFDKWPEIRDLAPINREFLGRLVRHLAGEAGIRQFIDLGSGLPTGDNVHEVAQRANPDARVVYVDYDPETQNHSRALLGASPQTAYVNSDIRFPDRVLDAPDTRRLIDFSQPTALLIISVLHFFPNSDNPAQIVARYLDVLPAGSFLALSHATSESAPDEMAGTISDIALDARIDYPFVMRPREDIEALFCGLPLLNPGLVDVQAWRPVQDRPLGALRMFGGLARKR
jgi:hypothetical protein